jgi:hypothetical protein
MALISRFVASFQAIIPVPNLNGLDSEFNQVVGANGLLNGGSSTNRILTKYNHATEPVAEFDQLGAGNLLTLKQNGVSKLAIANSGQISSAVTAGTAPIAVASTTVCPNLNADLLDGLNSISFALATAKTAFSISFGVADPSTPTVGGIIPGTVTWVCPDGVSVTVTKISAVYQTGSHAGGTGLAFQLQHRSAASSWVTVTNFGTIGIDAVNNVPLVVFTVDIVDFPISPGDTLIMFISSRTGVVTERDVTISARGTQQVF